MQDQQQTLMAILLRCETEKALKTRGGHKVPLHPEPHEVLIPARPLGRRLPATRTPGWPGCRGRSPLGVSGEVRGACGERGACGASPRGGGGRRRGRKEDGTNLPTESISRRRCKSRMLWISLCASRSMSSCGISASFKDTHTAGHRAVPPGAPAAPAMRGAAPPPCRGGCGVFAGHVGMRQGENPRAHPPTALRGAPERSRRPRLRARGGCAPPARLRHGSVGRQLRTAPPGSVCPAAPSPEPRSAAAPTPGSGCPSWPRRTPSPRRARAPPSRAGGGGGGEPRPTGRRHPTSAPRRGSQCRADRVPGKVRAAVQRRAPRSPRPGPPVATPGRGSAPPPSPTGRRAGELPTAPGELHKPGPGVLGRGGFTQVLPAALAVPAAAVCSAGRRGGGPAPRTLGFRTAAARWHPRGVDILSYIYYKYYMYNIHINS